MHKKQQNEKKIKLPKRKKQELAIQDFTRFSANALHSGRRLRKSQGIVVQWTKTEIEMTFCR